MTEKQVFWIRLVSFILIGFILPFGCLVYRFHLFQKIEKINIGAWGVLAVIFVAIFFLVMLKMIKKGLPYSFPVQCINGLMKCIIPLIVIIAVLYVLQDYTSELLDVLIIITLCEVIAIPLNPLPKWANDNKKEQEETKFKKFAKLFWENKDNEK
jgi:hypothetical protein